jgi:hypothetical protein
MRIRIRIQIQLKLQEKPSALKREHPVLKNMKILDFFLFLCIILPSWIRIRIQQLKINVDPSGSGSADQNPASMYANKNSYRVSLTFH